MRKFLRPTALLNKSIRVLLGCVLYAASFQFFLYHNAIPTGGITDIAMILNYLLGLPVGVMTIIMNIPIFIVAWKKLGFRLVLASGIGMALSSVIVDLFALLPWNVTGEPILACLFAGVIKGFGLGLVYSTGATTGGIDVVAKLLRRRYQYINFGTLLLGLDLVIVVLFAVIFHKYDGAMYGLITMFVSSKVVDFVLYGALTSKMCYIISDAGESVKKKIVDELQRGVTVIHGIGAYSGQEKEVLLCVVKRQQIVELRRIVRESDERAFLIFTDARDVYGNGFMNLDTQD